MNERYEGCRSWVSLDEEIASDDSQPVLDEAQLRTKVDAVAAALSR